ncbi:MAG: hypothetical protein IKM61_07425 [Eubacteriaceae bacterium]|nr:hypothetical protein [Eubacteriaceae bacterium]
MYDIQSRWKIENKRLVYYGLRRKEDLFRNTVKLSSAQEKIISSLPKELSVDEKRTLGELMDKIVLESSMKRVIPKSLDEATFCRGCAANDFIIPGIEFDEDGFCPICTTYEETKGLKSLLPVMNDFPVSTSSRFDVAVFYTGGKDSTYLLYYLSKVKKLRVLALTWEIPFMSESARLSIEGAKKSMENVEFVSAKINDSDLKKIYRKLYALSGNTCACPSLAYVLFYPLLVENKVPYFVAGNEPAQVMGLYYNHMAPKTAYSFAENAPMNFMYNIFRILTLRPPLKSGQFQSLATMKQLYRGENIFQKAAGYHNELVSNIVTAIKEVPSLTDPLRRAVRRSSRTGNIPAFVQVDLDWISGGVYDWRKTKDIIIRECGWVAPESVSKGLHTSCSIERCKEYTQFIRFYNMQSTMIPFSALEIAIAGRNRNLPRDEALREMKKELGFSLEEIGECEIMKGYLK